MNANGQQACYKDGEIHIDIFRGEEAVASQCYRNIPWIGQPKMGGDVFVFPDMPAGVYLVAVRAFRHQDIPEEVEFSVLTPSVSPEQELVNRGYVTGKKGMSDDGLGPYEIVTVSPPMPVDMRPPGDVTKTTSPKRYKAILMKRYYIAFPKAVWTHVSPEEQTDHVLAIVPVPVDDSLGMQLGEFVAETSVEKTIQLRPQTLLRSANREIDDAFGGLCATVAVHAIEDYHGLFTAQGVTEISMDVEEGIILRAFFAGAGPSMAAGIVLAVVPPLIVSEIGKEQITAYGSSDDFTADAKGSIQIGGASTQGQVSIDDQGEPLYSLRVQAEVRSPDRWVDCFEEVATVDRGKHCLLKWSVTPDMLEQIGPACRLTGHLRLRYMTKPHIKIVTEQHKPLVAYETGSEPEGDGALRIVGMRADFKPGINGPHEVACITTVKNQSDRPVRLYLRDAGSGTKYSRDELKWKKQEDSRFESPYGLGLELKCEGQSSWTSFGVAGRVWIPVVFLNERLDEVTLAPGESQEFYTLVSGGLLPMPKEARAFIMDPDLSRIEEKSLRYSR